MNMANLSFLFTCILEGFMKKFVLLSFVFFVSMFLYATGIENEITKQLPNNALLIGLESNEINGAVYHHVTYLIDDKDYSLIFDKDLKIVEEKDIITKPNSVILDDVYEVLNNDNVPDDQIIKIDVKLITPQIPYPYQNYILESNEFLDDFALLTDSNGTRLISLYEYELFEEIEMAKIRAFNKEKAALQAEIVNEFAYRNDFVDSEFIEQAIKNETSILTIELPKEAILPLWENNQDLIVAIGLFEEPENEIANALLATSVDPYVLNFTDRQGNNIGIYLTEPTCPDTGYITRYHRFSDASSGDLSHSQRTTGIARSASPLSYIYCKAGSILPSQTELEGVFWITNPGSQFPIFLKKPIHIISASFGNNKTSEYKPQDSEWDQFSYDNNIVIFKSAGNTGNNEEYVTTPGKGLNLITVGNYCRAGQTACSSPTVDTIKSSSSWRDPETKNSKPELSAPGTSIVYGGLTADSGTSYAAPHAAGIAADFMGSSLSSYFKYNPAYIKAQMLVSSGDEISGGYSKVGVGGIDFRDGYYESTGNGSTWVSSEYSASVWNNWANNDVIPNNGYIDWNFTVSSSTTASVKVALVWMNSGNYTYSHKNDTYPLGLDLDLYVYDPNGNLVASSVKRYNGFEFVSFTPTVLGTYRVQIRKYAVRDTGTKLNIAVRVNKDD